MDEEKNEQAQENKGTIQKAAKKLAKQKRRKIIRKVIIAILPKLLMIALTVLIAYIIMASISNFLDYITGEESKQASTSATTYSFVSRKLNKITVSAKYATDNGAYQLKYKFKNENGKICTEEEAIQIIKENLLNANEKIDLTKFTNSELKTIGSLMNNGLETEKYSEDELKALALFVKADIAGKNFDLSSGNRKQITAEESSQSDEVYGTLELHKTTATEGGFDEVILQYVPYATFRNMVRSGSGNVLNCFSINPGRKIVLAKSSSTSVKYTYLGENGKELSNADKAKIDGEYIGEDEKKVNIKEYIIPIDYEQYTNRYIASYGFLSDLLLATNNASFCMKIAELALNSKIVINVRDETTRTEIYDETVYTQTTLVHSDFHYTVRGYKITATWETIASGIGEPTGIGQYGGNSGMGNGATWSKDGDDYRLITYVTYGIKRWSVQRKKEDISVADTPVESGNTFREGEEPFSYTLITEFTSENHTYDIDISEIDCWYLKYKKTYAPPKINQTLLEPNEDVDGKYPDEWTLVQESTSDASIIAGNGYVQAFIRDKERDYIRRHNVDDAKCTVSNLSVRKKTKLSSKVKKYDGVRTTYKFADESDLETTQAQFKNIVYIGDTLQYSSEDENGFLYIYDQFITGGIDLCLHNDAEKKLFEMLESDESTEYISDVMKFLLYCYDGIDRGVTDLDKTFRVIGMSLRNYSLGVSAFGHNLTREEFIEAAQAYQGDSILAGLAGMFYDICTLPEYNVNPCWAYSCAAYASSWGESAVENKNLFKMGTWANQSSEFKYKSYEDSIRDFCRNVVKNADESTAEFRATYERAQEYATINTKFAGKPENNIYALWSRTSWIGDTHTDNARKNIHTTYEYLNNGIYECRHSDQENTTLKERADYLDYMVSSKIDLAKEIFGKNCFISYSSLVEAAYEVSERFISAGVYYAAAHKGGNNIKLPNARNIQECYEKPLANPSTYGIVCTTFVNLALWKSGIVDEDIINSYNIHSPLFSDLMMKSLDGWEVITNFDDLQEGDVVYSDNHTWIYMDGNKMLDESYCVIHTSGDSRGILKNANKSLFIRGFRYVGS